MGAPAPGVAGTCRSRINGIHADGTECWDHGFASDVGDALMARRGVAKSRAGGSDQAPERRRVGSRGFLFLRLMSRFVLRSAGARARR